MKLNFNERRLEANESMHEHAEAKLKKLDRFFQKDAEAIIKFSSERGIYVAEVTVHSAHTFFRAEEKSGDLVASLDAAVDAIERQIRKNKTRLEKRLRAGAFDRNIKDDKRAAPEEDDFSLIRKKRFPIKPMTAEEAILQMNLLEHEFFVFKNAGEDNRFSVVYKRKNGGYGLIDSE